MASNIALPLRIIACSTKIVERCGDIIRNVLNSGNLSIVDKGVNDPQTEADRLVQACIVKSLDEKFSDIKIIGEEELKDNDLAKGYPYIVREDDAHVLAFTEKCPNWMREVTTDDILVWVDPIDGTKEYTVGLIEHVTVLIGISVGGQPIGGVIYQPFAAPPFDKSGRTLWALQGLGAFCCALDAAAPPHPLSVRLPGDGSEPQPPLNHIIATTKHHSNEVNNAAIAACLPSEVVRVGGCGYKILLLLDGVAHSYVFASTGCKKWDTCAPEAVLRCLGGELTDVAGNKLDYVMHRSFHMNRRGVIASMRPDWHENLLLSKMPQSVKDALSPPK